MELFSNRVDTLSKSCNRCNDDLFINLVELSLQVFNQEVFLQSFQTLLYIMHLLVNFSGTASFLFLTSLIFRKNSLLFAGASRFETLLQNHTFLDS